MLAFSERVRKYIAKTEKRGVVMDAEEFYIEKLNNGLYTLQRVVLVLAEVCCNGPVQCRDRAEKLFKMKLKNPSLVHHLGPVRMLLFVGEMHRYFR